MQYIEPGYGQIARSAVKSRATWVYLAKKLFMGVFWITAGICAVLLYAAL